MRNTIGLAAIGLALSSPATGQPIRLDEIVISANRAQTLAARTGSAVSVLTGEDLAADGRPFALDALADLPGVTVQQNGPAGTVSGFAVRGAPQQYVRVLVDGIEISDPTAPQVTPSLSGLLIDDLGRIEVLRGSQSALYGGQAVGGVIDITAARPERDGIEHRVLAEGGSFGTARARYTLAGRNDRAEGALSLLHFRTDGFSAAEAADGNTEDDGFETTRLSASGSFALTESTTLFASAFRQREDGDYDAAPGAGGDAPNTFEADSLGLRAGIDLATESGFEHRFALSWFDIDRVQVNSFGPFATEGERARAEYAGRFRVSDALGLQFGADYTRERAENTFAAAEDAAIAGLFGQADWTPGDALTLNAALRLDEHSEFGFYPTGRLTAAWLVTPETTLRGSLGTGFRPPSLFELYDPFAGDLGFDPETSISADIGLERRFAADRGRIAATLFWLEIDDLIEFDPATFAFFQADGTAESRGLELAASWDATDRVTLAGAYTYTHAELPGGDRRDRIPRHDLALSLTAAVTDRLDLDLGARLVRDYQDDSALDFAGNVIASEAFAEDFSVLNARLAYAVTDDAELYLRAENLLDEEYQTARGYSTADRSVFFGVTGRF